MKGVMSEMDYASLGKLQEKLNTGNSICTPFVTSNIDYICGCGIMSEQLERKRDCFFYQEEHDMGATVPCCRYHGGYGNCPCKDCDKYVSWGTAAMVIKAMVDRGDFKQNGKNG